MIASKDRTRAVDPHALAASGRFGNFKPETEQAIRTAKFETNKAVERMKRIWKRCTLDGSLNVAGMCAIDKLRYSAKDLEEFSIAITEFQGQKGFSDNMGFFLSHLINHCKENEIIIHTAHLTERIDNLGYCNTRNIIVRGDIGWKVGYDMGGGAITVEGNAGGDAGLLINGGTIVVKGNAGFWVGRGMKGGAVIVEGDTDENVGYKMTGGEIRILGDTFKLHGDFRGGKIYHGNELIADKIFNPGEYEEDEYDCENR